MLLVCTLNAICFFTSQVCKHDSFVPTFMLYFSQVKLHFTESALRLIAKKAISKNTGARGLRAILETILMEAMYEVRPLPFYKPSGVLWFCPKLTANEL